MKKTNEVKDYDGRDLPVNLKLDGKMYEGDATFVNGYNGYSSTAADGVLCALIGGSCWNESGAANALIDENGFGVRSRSRRGQTICLTK